MSSSDNKHFVARDISGESMADLICSRRSSSPKALAGPGPSDAEIKVMIRAAVSAPDHGLLRPWRFIRISRAGRDSLGELFAEAKKRNDPGCTEAEVERERDRAARAPTLLGVVASLQQDHDQVTEHEQLVSVGAALQNILLVAHAYGYGARVVSGSKTQDRALCQGLGLTSEEELIGFICIGRATREPKWTPRSDPMRQLSFWTGPL